MYKNKFYLIGIALIIILSNCKKEDTEDVVIQNQIYYQSFAVNTTNYNTDTLYYDIDGDLINDIRLTKRIDISTSSINCGGSIIEILDTMKFCYLKTQPEMSFVGLADEINNSSIYKWNDEIIYSATMPYISPNNYWASDVFTNYIGFQIKRNNQNYYGWLNLKHFVLKEIGLNKTPNQSILVGQKE